MTPVLLLLFFASLLICLFIYAGYPAVLWVVSRWWRRPIRRAAIEPSVSVLIPVHNEEEVIASKLENTLELDYPADKLEILVLSDGSSDGTEQIVNGFQDARIRFLGLPRKGKIPALNEGARVARGEILVLTDANSFLEGDCLTELVANFADPEVGGVCGNKKYRRASGEDATEEGENLYWRLDKWEKLLESSIGSIFAADGAIYAVRRELFVTLEDPAQADDIAYSARVVLQGKRLVFEPRAVAYEAPPQEGRDEFRRKIRVTNHSVRALLNLGSALWNRGFYSFELLAHKLVRHLIPLFLLLLLISNALLLPVHPFFAFALVGQLVLYLLGWLGYLLRGSRVGRAPLFSVPFFFCLVNSAALMGIVSILRGDRLAVWTPRSGLE